MEWTHFQPADVEGPPRDVGVLLLGDLLAHTVNDLQHRHLLGNVRLVLVFRLQGYTSP